MDSAEAVGVAVGAAFGSFLIWLLIRAINGRNRAVITAILLSIGMTVLAVVVAGAVMILIDAFDPG